MLKYLKHNEIDKTQWDKCVKNAENPMVYNLTVYLDIIHPNWEAFVLEVHGVYQVVIPVFPEVKMGFPIHRRPILAQQLGISYLPGTSSEKIIQQFISNVTEQYKLIDYPLNHANKVPESKVNNNLTFQIKTTQVLSLSQHYDQLKSNYRRDRKARLNQALKNQLKVSKTSDKETFFQLFSDFVAPKITGGVDSSTIEKIKNLISMGINNEMGSLYVVSDSNQTILSAGYFVLFANRLTYLFGATSDNGKSLQANTYLLDYVIRQHALSDYILDFEGSSVEGIRDFYKSFGSSDEKFTVITSKNLPPIFQTLLNARKKIHQLLNS